MANNGDYNYNMNSNSGYGYNSNQNQNKNNYQPPNLGVNMNLNMNAGPGPQAQYNVGGQNNFGQGTMDKPFMGQGSNQPFMGQGQGQGYSNQQNMTTTHVTINQQPVHQPQTIVITVNDPHICGNVIPILDPGTACVILILNIFFPGVGTMVMGCAGRNANCIAWFFIGWLQLIMTFLLIGWIWSIITGCHAVSRANSPKTVALLV